MLERHPERVAKKHHQDVRLGATLELMKNGPDGELTFQRAKSSFGFGKLNVVLPQLVWFVRRQVGAQQIGTFASVLPSLAAFDLLPYQPQVAVPPDHHLHLV